MRLGYDEFRREQLRYAERGGVAREAAGGRHVLDGIPEDHRAGGEATMCFREPLQQPMELSRLLERRIDQDEAATLLRRQQRLERRPAVERERLGAAISGEQARQ